MTPPRKVRHRTLDISMIYSLVLVGRIECIVDVRCDVICTSCCVSIIQKRLFETDGKIVSALLEEMLVTRISQNEIDFLASLCETLLFVRIIANTYRTN